MTHTIDERIAELKKQRDAVVLAHFYVPSEVQAIADYVGDSFYLSKLAASLPNKTIVFAGVEFMGESAKLLSPEKTVYLPEPCADCPMAHMVNKKDIDSVRTMYPDLAVVCYVNSTAEIKSWSDVCVTSSNALKIVKKLPQKDILFIPDSNLGSWIAAQVPEKNFHFVSGYCPIHQNITIKDINELKATWPHAPVLVHPECNKSVVDAADFVGSTSEIINYVTLSDATDFIIGTVEGVSYEIEKHTKAKAISLHFPKHTPRCNDMDLITKEKVLQALEGKIEEVHIKEHETEKAKITLIRMLELSK